MDIITSDQRHAVMSHIRGKNTSIEKKIRSALHKAEFRFRVCDRRYPGSPDLVFPRHHAVIFINGCFWHAHENCQYYRIPKPNVEFWKNKFTRNKQRDKENLAKYQDMCWRICTAWECAIRGKDSKKKIERVTEQIIEWLDESIEPLLEIRE